MSNKRDQRRGAAVLLEVLRSEGTRYVFGNPGTTELPLIDALVDVPDIHYVLALQEASAVAMSDGYAQAASRRGVLNLHTTGGLGHGLGNLLNAHVSGTPLVVTAGQQDSRHTLTDPLLYGDLVSIATPAVKWAQEVTHPDQIPILVRRAFHDCQTAPTGPVFLSLPMDVMEEMTAVDIGDVSTIDRAAVAGQLKITELADMLSMERTTLVRALKPLQTAGWVVAERPDIGRSFDVKLSGRGQKKLAQALPLWKSAQAAFEREVGRDRAVRLRDEILELNSEG